MVKVYPSILSADFAKLGEEIISLKESGADGIHIDVMDGVFVPNLTFGAPVVKTIRKCSDLFFDVHLMIVNPEKYIKDFVNAGADGITVHVEAVKDVNEAIEMIRNFGIEVGISIKPTTNIPDVDVLKSIDKILVMSVEPGFGGQKYIDETTDKLKELKRIREENNLSFNIEIDGGINFDNAPLVIQNGVDIIVAGSTVFSAEDKIEAICRLKAIKNVN